MNRKEEVRLYTIENGIYDQIEDTIVALENIKDILTKAAIDRTFLKREETYAVGDLMEIALGVNEVKGKVIGIEKSMMEVAKVD